MAVFAWTPAARAAGLHRGLRPEPWRDSAEVAARAVHMGHNEPSTVGRLSAPRFLQRQALWRRHYSCETDPKESH